MSFPAEAPQNPDSCEHWVQSCLDKIEHHFKRVNQEALDEQKHLKQGIKARYAEDLVSLDLRPVSKIS